MTDQETNSPEAENISTRPVAKFSGSGGLQVAVWKQRSDEGRDYFSTRIDRSYKDADGKFQSTQYLREGDLLRAANLIEQADHWIEQEKSKQRGSANPSSDDRGR